MTSWCKGEKFKPGQPGWYEVADTLHPRSAKHLTGNRRAGDAG